MPGEKNYFLASDSPLSPDIAELVAQKNIQNEYVNQYYFDDDLLAGRSKLLEAQMQEETQINRDFQPYMFIKQAGHWLSHFGTSYYLLALIPAVMFIALFLGTNSITAGLYTGGFTAASLEIVMLLAYQIFVGSIYLATALFFSVFMGGLAMGSLFNYRIGENNSQFDYAHCDSNTERSSRLPDRQGNLQEKQESPEKRNHKKNQLSRFYYILQFLIAAFALLLPLFIHLINAVSGWSFIVQLLFFILIFVLSFGIGFEFCLASQLQSPGIRETSGINYSTDLAGSAFGAFLTAVFLLPLLGLMVTCIIVAGLNVLSGTLAFSAAKTRIF